MFFICFLCHQLHESLQSSAAPPADPVHSQTRSEAGQVWLYPLQEVPSVTSCWTWYSEWQTEKNQRRSLFVLAAHKRLKARQWKEPGPVLMSVAPAQNSHQIKNLLDRTGLVSAHSYSRIKVLTRRLPGATFGFNLSFLLSADDFFHKNPLKRN